MSYWLEENWVMILVVILVIGFAGGAGYYAYKQEQKEIAACIRSGGTWEVTGYHYTATYVKSGGVLIPIESKTEEHSCVFLKK